SALQVLAAQSWPGNFRELRTVLDYAARGRERGIITESDLPESVRTLGRSLRTLTMMESAERDAIVGALRAANGNRTAAAGILWMAGRTLSARLRRYQIVETAAARSVRD